MRPRRAWQLERGGGDATLRAMKCVRFSRGSSVWLSTCVLFLACRDVPPSDAAVTHEAHDPQPAAPELYGAGLFSTGAWDFFIALSPAQDTALFCRATDDFTSYAIYETTLGADGHWSAPKHPSFAGEWSDADPHFSVDGRRVFFISNRPADGGTRARRDYEIWVVERDSAGGWGAPVHLPAPVNRPGVVEWSPSVTASGDLYFGARLESGFGGNDICVARLVDGAYQPPEGLGDEINTAADEIEPWIAPDESYLIFSAAGRPDAVGEYDLYISRRTQGVWQPAQLLGNSINTEAFEFNQSVSPDGEFLYFSSTRALTGELPLARFDYPRDERNVAGIGSGTGDIYRVSMKRLGVR